MDDQRVLAFADHLEALARDQERARRRNYTPRVETLRLVARGLRELAQVPPDVPAGEAVTVAAVRASRREG